MTVWPAERQKSGRRKEEKGPAEGGRGREGESRRRLIFLDNDVDSFRGHGNQRLARYQPLL